MTTIEMMQAQLDLVIFAGRLRDKFKQEIFEVAHEYVWREVLEWDEDPTDRNTIRAKSAISMLVWLESKLL